MKELNLRNNLDIGDLTFGVEIEFVNADLDKIKALIQNGYRLGILKSSTNDSKKYNAWQAKEEKYIIDDLDNIMIGGEVVSPILADNEQSYIDISNVCTWIKENGGIADYKTGGHIHIGSNILEDEPLYFYNLLKLWVAYEDIIFKFCYNGEGYRRNIFYFASPLYKIFFEYSKDIERCVTIEELLNLPFYERYLAINFDNYIHARKLGTNEKSTIEIRCPNGTLDPVTWQNNINFFIKLMLYAKNNKFDDEKLDYLISEYEYPELLYNSYNIFNIPNFAKANDLADLIFNNDIDKTYFLKQYQR